MCSLFPRMGGTSRDRRAGRFLADRAYVIPQIPLSQLK